MKILSLVLLGTLLICGAPARANVVINEVMYNTPGSPDVEWIELYNTGPDEVELDDWYFIDSNPTHPECLLMGDLAPGEFLLIVGDFATFTAAYPSAGPLNVNDFDPAGAGFGLSNGGEEIFLYDDDGFLVESVAYDDGGSWPGSPDGDGPSLELVNPWLNNNNATSWEGSLANGGTPGQVNSVFQDNQAPVIHDTDRDPRLPQSSDTVLISALVTDATDLNRVELFVDLGAGFVSRPMYDDGMHGDGAAADSLFAATIEAQPGATVVRYYVAAYDDFGSMVTKPSAAPASFHAYTVDFIPTNALQISEVMANNVSTLADEFGEFDDWIEIRNQGDEPINLEGCFLTDNFNDRRNWELPDVTLDGAGFLIIWCDNQPEQGALHAPFKLSSGGEDIALYDSEIHGNALLHGFEFGLQNPDVSFGELYGIYSGLPSLQKTIEANHEPEYLETPTPGSLNEMFLSSVVINEFQTTSEAGGVDDWIEFTNRSDSAIDISGWGVSDDTSNPLKWVFPLGTILDPAGYIVVDEVTLGFSLSSSGELIQLSMADGVTGVDFVQFDQQQPDVSYGRSDVVGFWSFFDEVTPGEANPNLATPVGNAQLPSTLRVTGVYPNPFNPQTKIHFELPGEARVTVDIYAIDGRLVRTIDAGVMSAGAGHLVFNGLDDHGHQIASGVFFARVRAGSDVSVVKMMLVK